MYIDLVLYRWHLGETVFATSSAGFNIERVVRALHRNNWSTHCVLIESYQRYKNTDYEMWDVSGPCKIRSMWPEYCGNPDAVVFVVDSADKSRIGEAKDELASIIKNGCLTNPPFLVLANKQDLADAASTAEVTEQLELSNNLQDRPWFIQSCCATTGTGLKEGLDWLSTQV